MTRTPLYRLIAWFGRPRECGYGKTPGAFGNCEIVLAPGRGVRAAGAVFCSNEHAALDQIEALL